MTPPSTARCPVCGRDWPLRPDGHTLTRHYTNRWPASVKHCRGGRRAASGAGTGGVSLGSAR